MATLDYQAYVFYKNGYRFKQSFKTLENAIDYAEGFKDVYDGTAYVVIYKPTGVPVAYEGNDYVRDNQAFMSFFV